MALKALQASSVYSSFNFNPISSPINTHPPHFCRVIRAQVLPSKGCCCRRRTFATAIAGSLLLPLPSFTSATTFVEDAVEGTGENVLARHVEFFDKNNDGVVYPWETYQGFRAIGSNILLSTVATFIINVGLSQKTRPGKFPSLLFPIEIKNIAKAKHGSDTGVYDTEGRFVPSKFEAIFNKHAKTNPNALTSKELDEMLTAMREPKDYVGWFGAFVEWRILFSLAKDKDGLLQRDTIRGAYDGSLFEKMENERLNYNKT